MGNEVQVRSSLQVNADGIVYQSQPTAFAATMVGRKGPTPGALTIPVGGKVIPLTELRTPGFCRVQNQDTTNYVELGLYNPGLGLFFPFMELQPGESFVFRFSRNMLEEYVGTGTGTTGPDNRLFAKANGAAVVMLIEAFEA